MTLSTPNDPLISNLTKLLVKSEEFSRDLEDKLLEQGVDLADRDDNGFKYFIITAELQSDTPYAPLTNLSNISINNKPSSTSTQPNSTMSSLRDSFPFTTGDDGGFVRIASEKLRKMEQPSLLLKLSGEILDDMKIIQPSDNQRINIKDLGRMSPKLIKMWQKVISDTFGTTIPMHLLYIKTMTIEHGCRHVQLATVGLIALIGDISDEIIKNIDHLGDISEYGCLSVLYERERYYRKAVAQAGRGEMIKYGHPEIIIPEIDSLKSLNNRHSLQVPSLYTNHHSTKYIASYRMTRFTPPTIMDLLTSVEGWRHHDIAGISRAVFRHLQQNYWTLVDSSKNFKSVTLANAVGKPLLMAIGKTAAAFDYLTSRENTVLAQEPVTVRHNTEFYEPQLIERSEKILNWIKDSKNQVHPPINNNKSLQIRWDMSNTHNNIATPCNNPLLALEQLLSKLRTAQVTQNVRLLFTKECTHGDPHFANLFCDASIPEDPLILSIDQTCISKDKVTKEIKAGKNILLNNNLFSDIRLNMGASTVIGDPAYDIAKLAMSTSCMYGLAYNGAFNVVSKNGINGFLVLTREKNKVSKLGDIGGASGSHLVAVDAPVCKSSPLYHYWACDALLSCYMDMLQTHKLSDIEKAVTMLRVWFYTIRHAFSVAELQFPGNIERAVAIYLLAIRFVSIGCDWATDVLEKIINGEKKFDNEYLKQPFLDALIISDSIREYIRSRL